MLLFCTLQNGFECRTRGKLHHTQTPSLDRSAIWTKLPIVLSGRCGGHCSEAILHFLKLMVVARCWDKIVIPSELFRELQRLMSFKSFPYPKGEKNDHRRWPYMQVILKIVRFQDAVEGIARKPSFTFWSWWWWPDAETWWESTYSIVGDKVIIEKSHSGGRVLWNRNWDLGWIWAAWHYWKKKDIWADYEQLLRPVFFMGQRKKEKKKTF